MLDGNNGSGSETVQAGWIGVEIVYAQPENQVLLGLKLPDGSTVRHAIEASGLLALFPEIDLAVNKVGIFGSVCALDHPLRQNDRVEIYRSLQHDPKDIRRLKAMKR
jgi:putative ubiquitin-RnfH superfamily antitoxin RatB of RatAB toxin-antitoxin module